MKEKTTIKQKHMKKILMMFCPFLLGVSAAWAQQSSGDYYEGLTRKIVSAR